MNKEERGRDPSDANAKEAASGPARAEASTGAEDETARVGRAGTSTALDPSLGADLGLTTEAPKRAYDSIMDYVPSTTMGEVIRPTRVWRIAGVGAAGTVLLAVGVLVAFKASSDIPTEDMVVPSPPPVVAAVSQEAPDTSSALVDDEVADEEILIIEADDEILVIDDDEETGTRDPGGGENDRSKRPKARSGRRRARRGESPPPGATIVELDSLTVRRTIRSRMVHVHRCYDEALRRDPDLKGRLEIEITIDIRGNVTHAAITRDTLRHEPTKQCILATLKSWKFYIDGWLRRPVEVSFPVSFSG